MANPKKESYFWTSYSDLMTTLFFVMLVLFVLAIVLLHKRIIKEAEERKASEEQLDKIRNAEQAIASIDTTYFVYDEANNRFSLKDINTQFRTGSANINDIDATNLRKLREAGTAIKKFVKETKLKNKGTDYILIIEGQTSRDYYSHNDELSYARALALMNYWEDNSIIWRRYPCEVIISGSGFKSPFRVKPDTLGSLANQRFVIHILPKYKIK